MKKDVCVITGGGSGMGLATAQILGKDNHIIIAGRTLKKLESAVTVLQADGIGAEAFACDIADRATVARLAAYAKNAGTISSVIHAAGMSPHMGEAKIIMATNAIGTININEAFYEVMESGSCIIDVASMSGYFIPNFLIPKKAYHYSRLDTATFMKKVMARINLFPKKLKPQIAYGISKNFVIWYAKTDTAKFGQKGIRIISVTPGSFETPMGELEKADAGEYIDYCAIKRFGKVEEIAELLAFCAGKKAGYLTGTDIICDGGCVASGCNPFKIGNHLS